MNGTVRETRDDLVEGLHSRFVRKGHTGDKLEHSPDKGKDDGVTVFFLGMYAVYDEGFEEDGAVL